jgi:hypothetical protein
MRRAVWNHLLDLDRIVRAMAEPTQGEGRPEPRSALQRLERIEQVINELYVERLVFSAAKVKRLLADVRALKAEMAAKEQP